MIHKTLAFAESKRTDPRPLLLRRMGKEELRLLDHTIRPGGIALEFCEFATKIPSPKLYDESQPATFRAIAEFLAKARNYMQSIPREKFSRDGAEMVPSPVYAGRSIDITLMEHVLHIAVPYAIFSGSATYLTLCANGVPLSKVDFPFPPAW